MVFCIDCLRCGNIICEIEEGNHEKVTKMEDRDFIILSTSKLKPVIITDLVCFPFGSRATNVLHVSCRKVMHQNYHWLFWSLSVDRLPRLLVCRANLSMFKTFMLQILVSSQQNNREAFACQFQGMLAWRKNATSCFADYIYQALDRINEIEGKAATRWPVAFTHRLLNYLWSSRMSRIV